MGLLSRINFGQGWMPDADAVSAPPNALLRMDNCILDELGVVALRKGSTPINAVPFVDQVHSLYTAYLAGVRYRFAAAGVYIYRNGVAQTTPMAGLGDTQFGATQSHIFMARSTTKRSWDGTTERQWGIPMSAIQPSSQPADDGERLSLGECNTGETPPFVVAEGSQTHATGQDATASGALQLTADATTGRATSVRTYSADLDTTAWSGGKEENNQDYFECWLYVTDPEAVNSVTVSFDCDRETTSPFADYFWVDFRWTGGKPDTTEDGSDAVAARDYMDRKYDVEGLDRDIIRQGRREDGTRRGSAVFPDPTLTAGTWTLLRAKRDQFTRNGSGSAGKGWDTVCRVRLNVQMKAGGTVSVCRFDSLNFVHGQLLGGYSYRYILARDAGDYVSLSPVSNPSDEVVFAGQSARVFIPPDSGRDPDATEVWLYRMGEDLNSFYRVATKLLSAANDTPFAMTAKWEIATIGQELTIPHGAANSTCTDEQDWEEDLIIYGFSNHNSDDELAWLADCGASLDLTITTAGLVIEDTLSDRDALLLNIPMETDNQTPPDDIVGIAGPYYDRTFCLTATTLWPSRVLNPESFSLGQAITVGNDEEVAYWVVQALGGLYVGTSHDIYRIDGTFSELPDGTIEAQKTPLNIDHPPVNAAVAKDGPVLVYLAHDGWRAMTGSSSTLLVGPTSLLYKGYTRHGLSPVNLATGRVKVAITKGQLVAITPEGGATDYSSVLYRYVFGLQRWYRHTYPASWRSIAREPDGTLIAGDWAGKVWVLDDASLTDDGTSIPITIWTRADDDGQPFAPKTAADVQVNLDTGGATLAIAVHVDTNNTASLARSADSNGRGTDDIDVTLLPQWRQIQLRMTGSFSVFYFGGYAIPYHLVPLGVTAWDSGPLDLGTDIKWIRQVNVKARAAAPLTVTCWFDGVPWPAVIAASTTGVWNTAAIHEAILGRNEKGAYHGRVPRIVITSSAPFFPYWVELLKRNTAAQTDKDTVRFNARVGGETIA